MSKLTDFIAKPSQKRTTSKFFTAVKPEDFKKAYKAAQTGEPNALFAIFEYFLSLDAHLSGELDRRISATVQSDYMLTPDQDNDNEKAIVEELYDLFDDLNFVSLLEEILKYSYFGVRVIEIVWGSKGEGNSQRQVPIGFNVIPNHFIYARKKQKDDEFKTLYVGDLPLDEYPEGKLLLMKLGEFKAYSDIDFTTLGKGLSTIRHSIFKYFSQEDWAAFNEVFGMPMRIATVDPQLSTDLKADYETAEKAVHDLGSDASAVKTKAIELSLLETKATGSDNVFDPFEERQNRAISQALCGQQVTGSNGKAGTVGANQTANGITYDIAMRDALRLDREIQKNIINVFYRLNHPNVVSATFRTQIKKIENLYESVKVDETLFNIGLDVSEQHLRSKYNFPDKKDDNDSVRGKAKTKDPNNILN